MIFHIAGGFVYILVLSRMPDRRYGEILWQRAAVKGIKRPALSNRIPCIEQAFSISSIRPVYSGSQRWISEMPFRARWTIRSVLVSRSAASIYSTPNPPAAR